MTPTQRMPNTITATNTVTPKPAVTDNDEVGALKPQSIPAPGNIPMKFDTMMKVLN